MWFFISKLTLKLFAQIVKWKCCLCTYTLENIWPHCQNSMQPGFFCSPFGLLVTLPPDQMCETNSNSKHFKQNTCTKNNASTLFSLKAIVAHRDIWSLQQKLCQCHFYKFIKFNKVHQKLHLNFKLHHTALQALIA